METRNYNIDILAQGVARIVGGFLSFFSIFILTYLFNESELGEYNLILSTVNIVASLGTLWLSQSILRFYEEKRDLGPILILTTVSTVICVLAYGILNIFLKQTKSPWVFAYIVILVLYNIFDAAFRRARKLRNYVLMELFLAISRVFPMVVFGIITKDYNSIFSSQCIVIFAFFVFIFIKNGDSLRQISFKVNINMLKKYLKFGVPLMGLSVSNWFLTTSDRFVIKYFGDNAQVGIYSTNYSLANSIYMMFALIVINAFHPIIMKQWEYDKQKTLKLVSHTIDMYFILMIPLTFYGCLKSNVLLTLFEGDLYASHNWIFNWTAIGIFFYGLSLLYHKYYELIEKTNMILVINFIAAVANLALNFILIPILGFDIASFTTFISYIIYIIIVRSCTYKCFKLSINYRKLFVGIISAMVFYIVDRIFVKNDSIFMFFVEGCIYVFYTLFVYHLTKVLNIKEVKSY